ncbi:MAG TPA: hypothetical protein VHY20_00425, partial [Pirellulales bacterium]|nr:hypothetical protein [Pirellulales bacterium]
MRYQGSVLLAGLLWATIGGCGPSAETSRVQADRANATAEAVPTPQPAETPDEPDAELAALSKEPAAENELADAAAKSQEQANVHPQHDIKEPDYLHGVKLIPREVLFGNPEKAAARLSHDGKRLAYLAPVDGVLNVWVGPADDPDQAQPVTKDTKRGIHIYFWAYDNQHILYMQDIGGDENWHVYSVHLESKKQQDLTPLDKVNAQVEGVSHKFPSDILVGLNNRDPRYHDIYRVSLESGERKLVQENKEGFDGFLTDDDYHVRFALRMTDDGGREMLEPDGDGWKNFMKIPMEDTLTTSPLGFDKSGEILYLSDSRDR